MADDGPEDATSQDYFAMPADGNYLASPRSGAPPRMEVAGHPADEVSLVADALDRLTQRIAAAEHRMDGGGPPPAPQQPSAPAADVGRVTDALDRLTQRIEAAEQRSAMAIDGVDQTVRGVLHRLENAEREQTAVAARFEGAVQEIQSESARTADRVRRIESEAAGPRSAEALRSLESTLGKVAGQLYDGETRTRDALAEMRARVDQFETAKADTQSLVDDVVTRIGARLEEAETRTANALRGLQSSFAQLDQRMGRVETDSSGGRAEARLEQLAATLTARVESARSEMAESLRASADGRFDRMERTLAEMSAHVRTAEQRSAQAIERMGREVIDMASAMGRRIQQVEDRGADAIEQVGGEVARIAQAVEVKLGRADTVQAQALERLGGEIARISERLTERIANSERRSAQAIDDVGEQVARVTERIAERHERSSGDLADRIRQSEERTARLLEEAREKLDKLSEAQNRAAELRRNTYDPDESLFSENPFASYTAPEPTTPTFPGSVWRQTQSVTATAYAPPPAPAWTQTTVDSFSAEDFEAADEFVTAASPEPATQGVDEALFTSGEAEFETLAEAPEAFVEPAPAIEAEPALEMTPQPAAETGPVVVSAPEAEPVAAAGPAPIVPATPADDPPLAVQALAAMAAPFTPHEETVVEVESAPSAFSLREAMQKARAAANANAGPAGRVTPPPIVSPAPAEEPIYRAAAFGRAPRQRGVGPGVALAAGVSVVAIMGFIGFQNRAQIADGLDQAQEQIAGLFGDKSVAAPAPQLAVALAPHPIGPTAGDASAPGGADTAALDTAYSAAIDKIKAEQPGGVEELRRVANLGYPKAQFALAKLYEEGASGVRKDAVEARRWTQRAAEGGDRNAMHNLALDYFNGVGGPRNATTAVDWFRKAAELGLVNSQFNLGALYEHGSGVAENPAEAYKWYLVAAKAGDAESKAAAARVRGLLSAEARATAERTAVAFAAGSPAPAAAGAVTAAANDIATAQKALMALGYYEGPTDGVSSQALRMALSAYQRNEGLQPTGAPDPDTIQRLATYVR